MSAATSRRRHDIPRSWWLPLSAVLLALAATISPAVGVRWLSEAVGHQPDEDSIQRDYANELPRTMPLSPEQALASFQVADGFEIQLVAAEPLVTDPIAMAFDENGRLFVVEMRDYSEHGDEHLGRIRQLRDHDGDGRYDQSTLFVEDLSWPTAIACYDGGIFVAAAPDIWYFKDQDDDGRADERRRVFTGFGRSNVQGLVNSFQWGLDLRIHGATSSCGATLTRADSPPTPANDSATDNEQQPLALRGRDFSFDPRTLDYQATSGGGQHGMSFDDWGRKFVCSNSDHLQQVMFEDRYLARNPYLAAPQARVSIAEDGPQAEVFRRSPVEPWRILRTRLRVKGIVPGPIEGGGTPAGYFTGATGVTIYRGHAWPAQWHGLALVADVGSNLIHRKRLQRDGLQFAGLRIDQRSEFITSSDLWFRPVQMANGPDGALYIADMYREVIEHPLSLPPVIKRHLDLDSGRDRGRIYRVVPHGFSPPPTPRLSESSWSELVAVLDHPNDWHRETAARLLYERRQRQALPAIRQLVRSAQRPQGRVRALRTMRAIGGADWPDADTLLSALGDEHPEVRCHAVLLAEAWAGRDDRVRGQLYRIVEQEQDPGVRYQLAFSLGQWPGERTSTALAEILRHDGRDPWIRLAAFSSLHQGAGAVLSKLAQDQSLRRSTHGQIILQQLARQIGKQQRPEDVAAVAKLLTRWAGESPAEVPALVQALAADRDSSLADLIHTVTGENAGAVLQEVVRQARLNATQSSLDPSARLQAIHLLRLDSFSSSEQIFFELLRPDQPAEIQLAALTTLGQFPDPRVARLLIDRWPQLSPQARLRAADTLLSRPAWLSLIAQAVADQKLQATQLGRDRLLALADHSDPQISNQAKLLLEHVPLSNRDSVLEQYREALQLRGDPLKGKAIFTKHCANCHRLQDQGHPIGPNLAAMSNRGDDAILVNVVDPNREVNPQFESYTLVTNDGKSYSGMMVGETATSVTLQRAEDARDTVLRIDIEQLRSSGKSLMPEGLEQEIDVPAMADLIAYLKSVQ